jgi:hypothetical protein
MIERAQCETIDSIEGVYIINDARGVCICAPGQRVRER